jgi:hypothetical protein
VASRPRMNGHGCAISSRARKRSSRAAAFPPPALPYLSWLPQSQARAPKGRACGDPAVRPARDDTVAIPARAASDIGRGIPCPIRTATTRPITRPSLALAQRAFSARACARHCVAVVGRGGRSRSTIVAIPGLLISLPPPLGRWLSIHLASLSPDGSQAHSLLGRETYGRVRPSRNRRGQVFSPPATQAPRGRCAPKNLPARVLR